MSKQKNLIEASQNVTFDTSGNVGIGTTSPTGGNSVLTIKNVNGSGSQINFRNAAATDAYIGLSGDSNGDLIHYLGAASNSLFYTSGTERMRIDSSGNIIMGKTTADNTTEGFTFYGTADGVSIVKASGQPLILNRLTNDGDIATFRKDGSTVGSIGNIGSAPVFRNVNEDGISILTDGGQTKLVSTNSSGIADNDGDIGAASYRWDDIYATNGTIQTSDRNEKQQIAALTTAEVTAAKAISQLFKTFKWNDSVTANGDAARTHAGVIAQEVETAMTNAGLDAGDYAFFISSTWWETQTDVPAVAADPDNGIEAKDAYTQTDTYDTLAEAPAGATERTRKGIRYPELLSFVGAATEQRLADIETRLTALEAV